MKVVCEECPVLAICISKESGNCELIYNELYHIRYTKSGVTATAPLSAYRKTLHKNVIYIKNGENLVAFFK